MFIVCKTFIIISALTFSFSTITGQKLPLQDVDQYLQRYQSRIPVPGFSIVIVEGDQVQFEKGYGVERQGQSKPMTPHSTLAIGSIGRGFTAMAVMMLVEEGLLDLDVPVITYLPWFKTANQDFSDKITLRMCLSNTSGLPPQYDSVSDLESENAVESFVRSFESFFIKRTPGMSHEFSDEGYSIAGLIISEVSGMTYTDYITKNILAPLEMTRSCTSAKNSESLDVVYGHEMGLTQCFPANKATTESNYAAAGSEFYSCVSDLGNYMIALLNDGKYKNKQLLSAAGIKELFKPNTSFEGLGTMLGGNGIDIRYSLGWMGMEIEGRDILIHTGGDGNVASIIGINKDKNQAFAMLFNADVNRLDRFEYPGMENTVNNVIHILNREDTTDFGVFRSNFATENDYELPEDKWSKYLGQYESFGKSNPFFKDMNIEVLIGEGGEIELKSRQENILKGHYKLDFTNESRAILRNISMPGEIQFTIYPDGFVGGLFMFGSEFKKRNEANEARFIKVSSPDNTISCLFPKSTKPEWKGNTLTARLGRNEEATLEMSVSKLKEQKFDDYILGQLQGQSISTKGIVNKTSVKKGIWTEQTVFVKNKGSTNQYLFAFFQDPQSKKQMQLMLKHRWGSFSSSLQEIIMNIQRSVTFQ